MPAFAGMSGAAGAIDHIRVHAMAIMAGSAVLVASCDAAGAASGLRSFHDWAVGCDNTLACRAVGLPPDDAAQGPYIVLDRPGGPDGKAALSFVLPDGELGAQGLYYSLDGAVPSKLPQEAFADVPKAQGDDGGATKTALTDAAELVKFLDAVRNGRALRFSAKADIASDATAVSLAGLDAALLFMDDVQGRVDTVTALLRQGPKPASAVPKPPQPPRVAIVKPGSRKPAPDEAPKALWARHVRETKSGECKGIDKDSGLGSGAIRISDDVVLYNLGCWSAAYQGGVMYYLATGAAAENARRLKFETIREATGKPETTLASITDPDGMDEGNPGELSSLNKGRGIGDCGAMWGWAWTGKDFRLTSYVTMPSCKGVDADDWITLWRTTKK